MSNLVIVAIPEEEDLVTRISSEKVPHVTLLFLGEVDKVQNVDKILDFLKHASETVLRPFWLDVDYRGVLGEDEADVVFFKDGWDCSLIKEFRAALLKNDAIFKANIAVEQFPEWIPHLTLGYPKTPAKKLKDYDKIYSVKFDRIALWIDDYEGPEFRLTENYPELLNMGVSMTDAVDNILIHYGKKGMKWGRRSKGPTEVSLKTTKKGKVKTKGGKRQPTHPDAITAKIPIQKGKKSGLDSLSNEELKVIANRLNLEQQVSKLGSNHLSTAGEKFVNAALELNKGNKNK